MNLANHPSLPQFPSRATATLGLGAGAHRPLSGEIPVYDALGVPLASCLRRPTALLFPTQCQPNMGVLTAVAGPEDLLLSDPSNHANIIDDCRLSRARILLSACGDSTAASSAMPIPAHFRRRLLATRSLFSSDRDPAPQDLARAVSLHDAAAFIVDGDRALGFAGPPRRGLAAHVHVHPHVTVGTLGKAFAARAAVVAASRSPKNQLTNRVRQSIHTTASALAITAAAHAAPTRSTPAGGSALSARALACQLRDGLQRMHIPAPGKDLIVPVLTAGQRQAPSATLRGQGILVPGIRPPTHTTGTARPRTTISVAHTPADVAAATLLSAPGAITPNPRLSSAKC